MDFVDMTGIIKKLKQGEDFEYFRGSLSRAREMNSAAPYLMQYCGYQPNQVRQIVATIDDLCGWVWRQSWLDNAPIMPYQVTLDRGAGEKPPVISYRVRRLTGTFMDSAPDYDISCGGKEF